MTYNHAVRGTPAGGGSGAGLPVTGPAVSVHLAVAGLLLGTGAVLLGLARRRARPL